MAETKAATKFASWLYFTLLAALIVGTFVHTTIKLDAICAAVECETQGETP